MERMQFNISIDAPVAAVYNTMIGKETFDRMIEYFGDTYPKALEKLKQICERS